MRSISAKRFIIFWVLSGFAFTTGCITVGVSTHEGASLTTVVPTAHRLTVEPKTEFDFVETPSQLWEALNKVVDQDNRAKMLVRDEEDMLLALACHVPDFESLEWTPEAYGELVYDLEFHGMAFPNTPALALVVAQVLPKEHGADLRIRCTFYIGVEEGYLHIERSRGSLERAIIDQVFERLEGASQ
jgi:hypothetical protein